MVDSPRYKDWLDKSIRDIKSAKILKDNDCGVQPYLSMQGSIKYKQCF